MRVVVLVMQTVLRGADVVVSAIGNRNYDEGITLRTDATRQILEGLNVHGRDMSPEHVADFVVDALGGDEYRRARVGIAY